MALWRGLKLTLDHGSEVVSSGGSKLIVEACTVNVGTNTIVMETLQIVGLFEEI